MERSNVLPSATSRMPGSLQALRRNLPLHHSKKARYILSCKATDDGRRDVLLRLLGGTAAATGFSNLGGALALPIQAPDLSKCQPIHHHDDIPDINCCPPYPFITDFKLPPCSSPLRVRPAAHLVDMDYLAKYDRAVELMKELPDDDPRSFTQQWHVHCAYCNGAYHQTRFPEMQIDIHRSWLFFPWHRLYLYFYERILGNLIGDDTFALPFWNWDDPDGMVLPEMYTRKFSPLYDSKRDPNHQPPVTVNLHYDDEYGEGHQEIPNEKLIDQNLKLMYNQMIAGAKKAELFLGSPYRAGDERHEDKRFQGTIECAPHNTVHDWTGERQPPHEDMGILYSAARDPVFFAHHGNVDRMWNIWRSLSRSHTDFPDADWLDSNFLFYDEEARLVRVRVRDCLDTCALRYTYQDVPLRWIKAKPTRAGGDGSILAPEKGKLPVINLEQTVRLTVKRPSKRREEEEEEVLIIEGIEITDISKYHKVDVYVNEPELPEGVELNVGNSEFAGSVVLLPHMTQPNKEGTVKMMAKFGISDLLEDIGADGDKTILVSLVPRSAGESISVQRVRIGYVR